MSLPDALSSGRFQFPETQNPANFTLVISHDKRKKVNRQRNMADRPKDAIFLRAPKITTQGNSPQNMWVWPGVRMLGAGGRCLKGVFYEIETCDEEGVTLTSGDRLNHDEAVKCLRLSHAITYASSQGLTLGGIVRLDDTTNKHFGLRHLYVGVSRCTSCFLLGLSR